MAADEVEWSTKLNLERLDVFRVYQLKMGLKSYLFVIEIPQTKH